MFQKHLYYSRLYILMSLLVCLQLVVAIPTWRLNNWLFLTAFLCLETEELLLGEEGVLPEIGTNASDLVSCAAIFAATYKDTFESRLEPMTSHRGVWHLGFGKDPAPLIHRDSSYLHVGIWKECLNYACMSLYHSSQNRVLEGSHVCGG